MTSSSTEKPEQDSTLTRRELFSLVLLGLGIAGLSVLIAFAFPSKTHPTESPLPVSDRRLEAFELVERSGQKITDETLAGKFLVVNFVFTGCSLSCLRVNDRMAEIQKLVSGRNDVRLVSLTIDPDSDTPESLTNFASKFGADSNLWLFLTGDKAVLYPLLEQSFLGPGKPELAGMIPGGFVNTDRIALVDKEGRVRSTFNGLKSSVAGDVVNALNTLRNEKNSQ